MAIRNARIPAMVATLLFLGAMTTLPYPTAEAKSKMQKQAFGKIQDGQSVDLYTLSNKYGMTAAISNFGATLVSLKVPDRDGKLGDVVLGYDNPADYENGKAYFGGTIGRYGNRIAHGKFALDGVEYTLPLNDGPNTLHGGVRGFNKRVWSAKDVSSSAGEALELTYVSKDGEEGFPGTLTVTVVYTLLADENAVKIDYTATTDKDTVLNLTNHSYFNLSGQGNGDILQHKLTLFASQFTPVDVTLIPTGKLQDVHNTPFDFLQPMAIGERINMNHEQLRFGKGYDHNWVLDKKSPSSLGLAARAYWKSPPPNPACSSTAETFWMAQCTARMARCTTTARRSAWKRSTFRIRLMRRVSLPRFCIRGRHCTRVRSISSRYKRPAISSSNAKYLSDPGAGRAWQAGGEAVSRGQAELVASAAAAWPVRASIHGKQ
jgi:aldose 1-epimerase